MDVKESPIRNGSITVDEAQRIGSVIDTKILEHSHNADAAMAAYEEYTVAELEMTEAEEKALLRKIDWRLMPVCFRGCFLSTRDKC